MRGCPWRCGVVAVGCCRQAVQPRYGFSPAVYDLLRTGQIASITLGRARRVPIRALTDFIDTRLEQEAAA
ncbi:hypothetical protein [Streptomyces sp. NPDC060205]|uniref:hypothetical protein n=1 Tax=Streptomyces sp. NPDC060205 TaxID=3347072 RepID=UPI00365BF056